ncbi:glycoside hydrolase family 95-like protein, partial [Spirosoma sp.]|uniref:glycoside hydrolase family 95-like protein n=1 Tax=Spirosoma sp. TaxID=1899569 RepID=UPI003B3A66B2
ISGLRARGGFEVVGMEWKDGKVTKVAVKSNLGGNLRLRVPNAVKTNGGMLKPASGPNANPFYAVEETPAAIKSAQSNVTPLSLKETLVYDLPTQKGKVYTMVME